MSPTNCLKACAILALALWSLAVSLSIRELNKKVAALTVYVPGPPTTREPFTLFPGSDLSPVSGPVPVFRGWIDHATCDEIAGWAEDMRHPERRVGVEIFADGDRVESVYADVFRKDLLYASIGDGSHGFAVGVSPELKDGKPHSITARIARHDFNLPQLSGEIQCAKGGK